ncbi:hypothetical protein EYZ11_001510 [Aspergillus tanneri]|uniref:Peroxisome chaperone and import receptor n=1 Tax=Aspergillus tanneri TaxID=1220188 RepID=A0A4S3JUG5_9EURO|nr:Peroxisome chaperone and import receptor [Aspergillus tanneri]KAA8646221.1 Peroxisome chaperone and import receptor [Aspergillus tanneri]THC99036.1 hypothetical protein EYZ11_001510 [Aspergillus tanneri]
MASSPPAVDPQREDSGSTERKPISPSTATDAAENQASLSPDQSQTLPSNQTAATHEDDDDSDLDDLDEVLDNFKPAPPAAPSKDVPAPTMTGDAAAEGFDEEAFMRQLEKDMANMMGQAAPESGAADPQGFRDTIEQGADAFTKQLEESGIPPGDFIKQLLADVMAEDAGAGAAGSSAAGVPAAAVADDGQKGAPSPESFNDAIQRTINRMKESGDKATAAASEDDISDDLMAQLLKAVEAGTAGAGDEGDLTKMFMGMMEQLSNKEMLYEPMKELHTKFGPWIAENKGKGKVSDEDMSRYETQAVIVGEIVAKFEEPGYTDGDPKCREYVWEKMQAMQSAGNPPDELVSNPWLDDPKGAGAGGMPDCPQQ